MVDVSVNENTPVQSVPLPQVRNLENLLQCPICYNYMKNPVISISCSHNFCSICIRKNISIKNSCPICFIEISDGVLRPNRCLDEIIKNFLPVKDFVLKSYQSVGNQCESDLSRDDSPSDSGASFVSNNDPSPGTSSQLLCVSMQHEPQGQAFESIRNSGTSQNAFAASPLKSFVQPSIRPSSSQTVKEVPCPVCNVLMREALINLHLDACLNKNKPPKRKPMPKLIYNLMKDMELKKRLKELGLSATGDRATLINRHKQYTILYNSECDATNPRPIEELKAQLLKEEMESRRLAIEARNSPAKAKTVDIETIERRNQQYLRENKESYDRLIDEIKHRQPSKSDVQSVKNDEQSAVMNESLLASDKQPQENHNLKVERQSSTEKSDSGDEITVLEVPPKVFETISLTDSSDDEKPRERVNSETSTISTSEQSSSCTLGSFPDPMESSCSTCTSSTSSSTSTSSDDSDSRCSLSTSRLDLNSVSSSDSSSSNQSLSSTTQQKTSKKRSKSPEETSFERTMSLRRRF